MHAYESPATSILHPTDFSADSESAFAHALAIALRNRASLTILHVAKDREEHVPWHDYPAVRDTLERWGHLPEGASRHDVVKELGIDVEKTVGFDKNVVKSIVDFTQLNDFDLIVMATNENREHPFWMHDSVSVPVSQGAHLPTLFVPHDVPGCVAPETGAVSLDNNGGFVQIAFDLTETGACLDASAWAGVQLDVYGNGETYDIRIRTDQIARPWQSFRAAFTAPATWSTVTIPFAGLIPHRTEARFDPTRLRRIGILAIGREMQADISIASFRLYR